MAPMRSVLSFAATMSLVGAICPNYTSFDQYFETFHSPGSGGKYNLSYMRPPPPCRTFNSSVVESTLNATMAAISDPDLRRLFENAWPNTLDTTVTWRGYSANDSEEELAFVITGDITAMWLRDSANQLQSYLPVLKASSSNDSLASLYRGVINLQARYLRISPHCQAFQPPPESGIPPQVNGAFDDDVVYPPYDNHTVFECKYELDSLAAFMEVSYNYYMATGDIQFFSKFHWVEAIESIMSVAEAERVTFTYHPNGSVFSQPYLFSQLTTTSEGTEDNNGQGNPVLNGTYMIRSFFRPSDDSCIFEYLVPSNMMFSHFLGLNAEIMSKISGQSSLANRMQSMSTSLRNAIQQHAIVTSKKYGQVYAYEIDGYDSQNMMDDANVPSLLSAPFIGFLDASDPVYQATRRKLLSTDNPYWMHGPVISAIGSPHDGPGMAWPMAAIMRIFTTNDSAEVHDQLQMLVSSTDGLGMIHESINTYNESDWTREWFAWANGLFGQCILDLKDRMPDVLKESYQGNYSAPY